MRAEGGSLIAAELRASKPLRVLLPQFAIDWDKFEPQTLSLRLDRMPLAWLTPYLPDIRFRSGELSANLVASARGRDGLRLTAAEPVKLTNLLIAYRDFGAQRALTATVRPTLMLSNDAEHERRSHGRRERALRAEVPVGDQGIRELDGLGGGQA